MNLKLMGVPPTLNKSTRFAGGRAYKTKRYKDWMEEQQWSIKNQIRKFKYDPVKAPYIIGIVWFVPDNRRRDPDNIMKPVLDVLQKAGVFEDDCWQLLKDRHMFPVEIDRDVPRIEVSVGHWKG